jgi:hypothetical protein
MRPEARPLAALALVMALAGCAGSTTSARSAGPSAAESASPTAAATGGASTPPSIEPPTPTPVPGAPGGTAPPPSDIGTTETDWGTILDAVPGSFPVYPGAEGADVVEGPASAAWVTPAGVEEVAAWYRGALEQLGLRTVGLSDPLEDGSRVLDSAGDLPECRVQTTFRPAGGSTMITVLYGAGCAGGSS